MELYRSIDLYDRPVIASLGLAYGLVDSSFTFTLYSLYINFFIYFKVLVNRY